MYRKQIGVNPSLFRCSQDQNHGGDSSTPSWQIPIINRVLDSGVIERTYASTRYDPSRISPRSAPLRPSSAPLSPRPVPLRPRPTPLPYRLNSNFNSPNSRF